MNGRLQPVPDLGTPRGVPITKIEVWPVVSLEVEPGRIAHVGGEYALRIVDLRDGSAILIPYQRPHLQQLIDNITAAFDATDAASTREGNK